jgi:hypothetical protein
MNPSPAPPAPMARMAPALVVGLFTLVAVLLFAGIYLALPNPNHFYALTTIGIVALLLCLAGYLSEALSADPYIQRAFAWGFGAMGFAILFAAFLLPLNTGITLSGEILALLVLIVLLLAWIAGIGWRSKARAEAHARSQSREAWASTASPSAFSYGPSGSTGAGTPPVPPNAPSPPGSR